MARGQLPDLIDALAQLVDGHVDGSGDGSGRELCGAMDVEEDGDTVLGLGELVPLVGQRGGGVQVLVGEAEHVHRILGAAEGRRIGQFQLRQITGHHMAGHCRGNDIDPLVNTLGAHALGSDDRVGVGVDEQLQRHLCGAGVVAGMVSVGWVWIAR